MALIAHNVSLVDDTCVPVTHDELLRAVKHGKSTVPDQDGLTYDILNPLTPSGSYLVSVFSGLYLKHGK